MDEFTTSLAEAAYEDCRQKNTKTPVTLSDLQWRMDSLWLDFRNISLEAQAKNLEAMSPMKGDDLCALMLQVDETLLRYDTVWELPYWDPEDAEECELLLDEQRWFVAWGIACLWQLSQWGIPYPDYEGLQAWLTRKNQAEQLIARKHTKTGDEVIQHLMF